MTECAILCQDKEAAVAGRAVKILFARWRRRFMNDAVGMESGLGGKHVTVEERVSGADPYEDIVYALPRLVHFHFKDKAGGKGVFNFPPPGDGDLDMPRLLKIALDAGYKGPVSAEVEFDDKGWPDYDTCRAAAKKTVANLHAMDIAW